MSSPPPPSPGEARRASRPPARCRVPSLLSSSARLLCRVSTLMPDTHPSTAAHFGPADGTKSEQVLLGGVLPEAAALREERESGVRQLGVVARPHEATLPHVVVKDAGPRQAVLRLERVEHQYPAV